MPQMPSAAAPAEPRSRERPDDRRVPFGPRSRLQRELIVYGAAIGCGLILMPFLIWSVGSRVLGPYTHGDNPHAGPFSLFGDFWVGLFHGSAVFWIVALGPAVLILLVRVFVALMRTLPAPGRGRRA
ncbi:MAG: hypothetical protein WAN26_09815 [Steroidobacteraceae bacterium]